MRKTALLLILAFLLSGCATYKFQKSSSENNGYLASYDGYPLPEYTIGKNKTLPQELPLAKERFKRRRLTVESYYKQMEKIQSRFKAFLWEPPVMAAGFVWGVIRWPFIAVADYKYNHNSVYRAKIDRQDEEKEALENARKTKIRKDLDDYIAKDLSREESGVSQPFAPASVAAPAQEKVTPVAPLVQEQEAQVVKEEPVIENIPSTEPQKLATPAEEVIPVSVVPQPVVIEKEAPAVKESPVSIVSEPPVAVISAKPVQGNSPLKVKFSAQKSYSKTGRIVAYLWDFGDGDTSTLKNPENTFWSTTFGKRSFTVTLTVRDQAGSASSTTSTIEVITQ